MAEIAEIDELFSAESTPFGQKCCKNGAKEVIWTERLYFGRFWLSAEIGTFAISLLAFGQKSFGQSLATGHTNLLSQL